MPFLTHFCLSPRVCSFIQCRVYNVVLGSCGVLLFLLWAVCRSDAFQCPSDDEGCSLTTWNAQLQKVPLGEHASQVSLQVSKPLILLTWKDNVISDLYFFTRRPSARFLTARLAQNEEAFLLFLSSPYFCCSQPMWTLSAPMLFSCLRLNHSGPLQRPTVQFAALLWAPGPSKLPAQLERFDEGFRHCRDMHPLSSASVPTSGLLPSSLSAESVSCCPCLEAIGCCFWEQIMQ